MQLTEHFTLDEFTHSDDAVRLGINNDLPKILLPNIVRTADLAEEIRVLLGYPIIVTSGYRCERLNRAKNGSLTSQHMNGDAFDSICPGFGSPKEVCEAIYASKIRFDQLIYEGTWVHVSASDAPRRSVLTASFVHGKAHYFEGIV